MTAPRRLAALLLATLLGACAGGVEVQYVILSPAEHEAATGASPVLAIGPVTVPDYLLRNEIVWRENAHRLHFLPGRRWAEPLDNGVQRIVGANLGARLGTARVHAFPGTAVTDRGYRIALAVRRFEAEEDRVRAEIAWELSAMASGKRVDSGTFVADSPLARREAATIAAALSGLLDRLAARLAAAVDAAA